MGRLPRVPLTIFDRSGVAGHQSLARDHLAYCDLASERQHRANDIVREMHALAVSRVERRNSSLGRFALWVWLYNTASTIRQGAKAGTDANVLKTKFALNWTGPYKTLTVGPCPSSDTPDGSLLGDEPLYLDLPTDMPGADAHRRVSSERCKPCTPRPRRHAQVPFGWVDAERAQQFHEEKSPISRDPRRRVGAPQAAKGGKDDRHGHHRP